MKEKNNFITINNLFCDSIIILNLYADEKIENYSDKFVIINDSKRIRILGNLYMRDDIGNLNYCNYFKLIKKDKKVYIKLDIDLDWIKDSNRAFPITICFSEYILNTFLEGG